MKFIFPLTAHLLFWGIHFPIVAQTVTNSSFRKIKKEMCYEIIELFDFSADFVDQCEKSGTIKFIKTENNIETFIYKGQFESAPELSTVIDCQMKVHKGEVISIPRCQKEEINPQKRESEGIVIFN